MSQVSISHASTRVLHNKLTVETQSTEPPIYTLAEGKPVQDPTSSVVLRGPKVRGGALALLEDTQLIETLAHFPRERIPERYCFLVYSGLFMVEY
jgi:catalase